MIYTKIMLLNTVIKIEEIMMIEVKWRHLVAKIATNACAAIWWTILQLMRAYIQKGGLRGCRTPQIIWIFRRKIVWERENYQDNTVYRANDCQFSLLMFSHCFTFKNILKQYILNKKATQEEKNESGKGMMPRWDDMKRKKEDHRNDDNRQSQQEWERCVYI